MADYIVVSSTSNAVAVVVNQEKTVTVRDSVVVGPSGARGSDANVQVGNTLLGAEGSNVIITNVGNSTNVILDFTIPRGNTGNTGNKGLFWEGPWNEQLNYSVSQAVSYAGNSYFCVAFNANTIPVGNTSYWQLLAQKGQDGNTGATGSQGPQGIQGEIGPQGLQGNTGPQGSSGADGVSVVSANVQSGNLILTLSNTATIDAGTLPSSNPFDQSLNTTSDVVFNTANIGSLQLFDGYVTTLGGNDNLILSPSDGNVFIQMPPTSAENINSLLIAHENLDGVVEIKAGSNTWYFYANSEIKFPDDTIQNTAFTGSAPIAWVSVPVSNTASGTAGQAAYDANGDLYICVATNTWSKIVGTLSW